MTHERPLVTASPRALREACAVVPGRVIETVAEDMILQGRVVRDHGHGPKAWLILGDGWIARAHRRGRSPLGTRRGWRLVGVEPHTKGARV